MVYVTREGSAGVRLDAARLPPRGEGYAANVFMRDLSGRLANRVQLTSDGHKAYLDAVERAFGSEIDYAMLVKHYGPAPEQSAARRYSPAECVGTTMGTVTRQPRQKAREHVLCRAGQPLNADGHSPLHSPDQRLFEEGRKSLLRAGYLLHALQLHSHSHVPARHPEVAREI